MPQAFEKIILKTGLEKYGRRTNGRINTLDKMGF
jgi:hypothetical protein